MITKEQLTACPISQVVADLYEHPAQWRDHPPSRVLLKPFVATIIDALDRGTYRVASQTQDGWVVHTWLKQAILLYFQLQTNQRMEGPLQRYYDKIPLKYHDASEAQLKTQGVRLVPGCLVRHGAYLASQTVLMPSYVNIGAYVDTGTLIDTWATVGSCAQIGKNVHLSGGVGIGGVLEPLQAHPTIIEDDCFIGARSEIVEGVIVERGAVIAMGVYLGQSTKIYHRATGKITYGRIPAGSVVVPGSLPDATGRVQLACAVIIKQVDQTTRAKTSINALLREA